MLHVLIACSHTQSQLVLCRGLLRDAAAALLPVPSGASSGRGTGTCGRFMGSLAYHVQAGATQNTVCGVFRLERGGVCRQVLCLSLSISKFVAFLNWIGEGLRGPAAVRVSVEAGAAGTAACGMLRPARRGESPCLQPGNWTRKVCHKTRIRLLREPPAGFRFESCCSLQAISAALRHRLQQSAAVFQCSALFQTCVLHHPCSGL